MPFSETSEGSRLRSCSQRPVYTSVQSRYSGPASSCHAPGRASVAAYVMPSLAATRPANRHHLCHHHQEPNKTSQSISASSDIHILTAQGPEITRQSDSQAKSWLPGHRSGRHEPSVVSVESWQTGTEPAGIETLFLSHVRAVPTLVPLPHRSPRRSRSLQSPLRRPPDTRPDTFFTPSPPPT